MMDSERDRAGRGAEGERKNSQAKGSDLDDTSESAGWPAHQRGNRQPSGQGNLSGEDGGRRTEGDLPPLFVCAKSLLPGETGFQAPSLRELQGVDKPQKVIARPVR